MRKSITTLISRFINIIVLIIYCWNPTSLYSMLSHIVREDVGKIKKEDFSHKNMIDALNTLGFVKFVDLIKEAGLTNYFANTNNITLFVPTDKAITQLFNTLSDQEKETVQKQLSQIIRFHILPNMITLHNIEKKTPEKNTHKAKLKLFMKGGIFNIASTTDPNQSAQISIPDIKTKNGIIHIIDTLLLPSDISIKLPKEKGK